MFKSLLKAAVGTVLLPVDIVADAVTLGGTLTDKEGSYTTEALEDIFENLKDATDPDEL